MDRRSSVADAPAAAAAVVAWTVTVTEPLPDCPSVSAAWERLATQTTWGEWRTASAMRGANVTTTVVPPATEPLRTGDAYIVKVGRVLRIRCRVLESSEAPSSEDGAMVFDAAGVALGGIVRARFRFTVFPCENGPIMARAQKRIATLPLIAPRPSTLESEHRHNLRNLNRSFVAQAR